MPSAAPQEQDWATEKFGGLDCVPVQEWLKAQGYKLTRTWQWIKPTPDHTPTEDELRAIYFLIDEWDYDGLIPAPAKWTADDGTIVYRSYEDYCDD